MELNAHTHCPPPLWAPGRTLAKLGPMRCFHLCLVVCPTFIACLHKSAQFVNSTRVSRDCSVTAASMLTLCVAETKHGIMIESVKSAIAADVRCQQEGTCESTVEAKKKKMLSSKHTHAESDQRHHHC